MKRGTLLKAFFGVAFAMLVANGIFGQHPINGDYESISGDQAAEIDSVTVGSTTGYWVLPDPYYNPNAATTGELGTSTQWNWDLPTNPSGATFTGSGAASYTVDTVYVEVAWPATGLNNITVNEELTAGAGCASSDTNVWVRVIAEPTVTYSADNPGTVIGADLNVCEGDARLTDDVQAALTGVNTYQLQWTLQITTLQADQMTINDYWDINKASLGAAGFAIERDGAAGTQDASITTATYNLDKPTDGLFTSIVDGLSKATTVYTYTVNGVTDRISRKSDYLTNPTAAADSWSWYDTTAETITITVNPAPETGPIYHIPNDWAN
jgi:hypothetical protein